jgi:integrase/recombinase XerD
MKTYLDYKDIELIENNTSCLRDRLFIRLLFHPGFRVSEALALKIGDVDFEGPMVTILHLKTRIKISCPKCKARLAKRHQFCPACGGVVDQFTKRQQEQRRIRTLPVDDCTMLMLKDYIKNQLASSAPSDLIFGFNRHRAWQIVKTSALKASIPNLINPETGRLRGVSPHRLRDAFSVHAMKLNDSGDGLRLLQEHLGHASFNTTAKYRKIAGDEHRSWYDQLWSKPDKQEK